MQILLQPFRVSRVRLCVYKALQGIWYSSIWISKQKLALESINYRFCNIVVSALSVYDLILPFQFILYFSSHEFSWMTFFPVPQRLCFYLFCFSVVECPLPSAGLRWSSGWESPRQRREPECDPCLGKVPCSTGQQSPQSRDCAAQQKSRCNEKRTHRNLREPKPSKDPVQPKLNK